MQKHQSAIGLLYDRQSAPNVSAKGFGVLAEEIITYAKEHDILVHQDEALANALENLKMGDEIPRELYFVVAELIAFSYVLQGKFPPGWQNFQGKLHIKA
jgi:flagellar biosynthesis protein